MGLRYLSLFSGIEAATQAWHPLGWEAVGFAEIETFPCKALAHHYPNVPNLGSVTDIADEQIAALGPIDLVVGGSPCQDLSAAGKRAGLAGARSNLFHEQMRIFHAAKHLCGARFCLWENVPGAFSTNKGRDFAAVVGEMAGFRCGVPRNGWQTAGAAVGEHGLVEWRVLDAQYVRVESFPGAVPQRRRRVFALLDTGDWASRAPILFEPEGLSGNPPPSREAGQGATHDVAPCIGASGRGFERAGETRGQGPVVAYGGNNTSGPIDVATAVNAHGGPCGRLDFESETSLVPPVTGPLTAAGGTDKKHGHGWGHQELTSGFAIPVAFQSKASPSQSMNPSSVSPALDVGKSDGVAVCFSCKDHGADAGEAAPTMRAMGHDGSHANAGGQLAVAFDLRGREGGAVPEGPHDTANIRAASGGSSRSYVAQPMAVRRLTPRECERLQGFPDDFTMIPWRGKPVDKCPDGPRYKSLGNSMAVNVMSWIGQRIAMVAK